MEDSPRPYGLPTGGLNPTVHLFTEDDYDRCSEQIRRSVVAGSRTVQIALTFQYALKSIEIGHTPEVERICWERLGDDDDCHEFGEAQINFLVDRLSSCFESAKSEGLEVSILIHLNGEHPGNGVWRNNVSLNPLARLGGLSYAQLLETLIVRSADQAQLSRISVTSTGEMGSSLSIFPESHRQMHISLKNGLESKGIASRIGVGVNHDKSLGRPSKEEADIPGLQTLIDDLDFLGISAYSRMAPSFEPKDFDLSRTGALNQLRSYGLNVDHLETEFTEVGLGGGARKISIRREYIPATTIAGLLASPWAGFGDFEDLSSNPWNRPENRETRREYFESLLCYVDSGKISRAFMWNLGSWDPLGLFVMQFPDVESKFADSIIESGIRRYNEDGRLPGICDDVAGSIKTEKSLD